MYSLVERKAHLPEGGLVTDEATNRLSMKIICEQLNRVAFPIKVQRQVGHFVTIISRRFALGAQQMEHRQTLPCSES